MLDGAGTGRPGISLQLNPEGACAAGIEVGVEQLSVIAIDLVGQVIYRKRQGYTSTEPSAVIAQIYEEVALLQQALRHRGTCLGLGITIPGILSEEGEILLAPNLGWRNYPIRKQLGQLPLPFKLENDANASALGEYYFGETHHNLLFVLLDVGIGGGYLVHGAVQRGSSGAALEIGHLQLDPQGPLCGCGRRGCLEAIAGRRALLKKYQEAGGGQGLEALVADLSSGRASALRIVQEWAQFLAEALVSLVNVLNPEHLLIGGSLAPLIPFVEPLLQQKLSLRLPGNEQLKFSISKLGDDAAAMGGAALIYQDLFRLEEVSAEETYRPKAQAFLART